MNGYWVFQAPIDYEFKRINGHGKMLVRKEPIAAILQEALEGFAAGRLATQAEFKCFLEGFPEYPKNTPAGEIHKQRILALLTRKVYAGYIESPDWDVSLRKGQHEGLISFEIFQKIKTRLTENVKAPARKDISADFPLRGFVLCHDCGHPLTSCWSKSHTGKRHPYYLCQKKGCDSHGKSIRRTVLEDDFAHVLRSLKPTEKLFKLAKTMFKEAWNQRTHQANARQSRSPITGQ